MTNYIKVVGYRKKFNQKKNKYESHSVFMDKPYHFESHAALFDGIEGFLATLDPNELYNLHYTLHHLPEGSTKLNAFYKYEVVPFDVDHIDNERKEEYIQAVEKILTINRTEMVIVSSGNGLHFLVKLKTPITTNEELKLYKDSYDRLCEKIEEEFVSQKLIHGSGKNKTHLDKQIFRVGTLRLPGTRNIKHDKTSGEILSNKPCEFITRFFKPKALEDIGLFKDDKKDIKAFDSEKYWSKTDSKFIFDNCGALKEFKEKKGRVSYQAWFSSLSVISRLNDVDGQKLAHKLSSGHPDYDYDETQNLIDATLYDGGPHKCKTFKNSFDACKTCTLKCTSPIQLRSKAHLKYEEKGFHVYQNNGWVPYYKEMIMKIEQEYNYKVVGENQELWLYDEPDNLWRQWPYNDIRSFVTKLMKDKPGDVARTVTKNELVQQIKDRNPLPANYFLDKSAGKINFKNGILHIDSNNVEGFEFKLHSAESHKEGMTYCLPFPYDKDADCPNFKEFISDICLKKQDLIDLLVEYLGYVLSNDEIWEHKALILKGDGANGKSVLLEVIKSMIGENAYSILNMKQMQHVESRAKLIGAIANISDESPKNSLFDAEDFKNLISGGEFEYRVLYHGMGTARNRAKFLFSTNYDLYVNDKSSAVKRRLFIVPMDANFDPKLGKVTKTPNPNIINDLKKESSGIFNYCIKAYMEAKKRGHFTESKTANEKSAEMFAESNPVYTYLRDTMDFDYIQNEINIKSDKLFEENMDYYHRNAPVIGIDEVTDEDKVVFAPTNTIRQDFSHWAEEHGFKAKYSAPSFTQEIYRIYKRILGPERVKSLQRQKRIDSKVTRGMLIPWRPYIEE